MVEVRAERASKPPRITLIGRPGCHLCDGARRVIEEVCAATGESYVELDLDEHDDLPASYDEEIPVTLVDGKQHDFWRVDRARLLAALGY